MEKEKIIIVGAGLCGTLLAVRMAQRGYQIHLYERSGDMRLESVGAGRSINLALSSRGLAALDKVGLKEEILKECIPMKGRLIHPLGGDSFLSKYSGREEDYINSVSRWGLNVSLLNMAEKEENITLFFNHKCTNVDLENATASFNNATTNDTVTDNGSVVIGTDGAGSAVRKAMMGKTTQLLFNYSQDFLRHGYKELTIQPGKDGAYQIEKNALHIWPRGSFMIIALPNLDGSFTVTMFHPFEGDVGFNNLTTKEKVQDFFEEYFPTLIPYIPNYVEEFFENPVGTLGTIKCYPWQAFGKTLIMGDAAHAIVPFYGQGMNASFEDVRVFDDVMDEFDGDWTKAFQQFQELRYRNTNAIADLAIDNFIEMQDKVDDEDFKKKRKLEMQLEQKHPDYYSKYSLVTFRADMPYAKAMELGRAQDELLLKMCADKEVEEVEIGEVYEKVMALGKLDY
ncbi:MAG: kynurenine 3-monooxygenase [Polaribacter sp.]|jgi:kynurenine 3-monooxygenase